MEYNNFKLKINAQKEQRYFKIVKNDSEYDIILLLHKLSDGVSVTLNEAGIPA